MGDTACGRNTKSNFLTGVHHLRRPLDGDSPGSSPQAHKFTLEVVHDAQTEACVGKFRFDSGGASEVAIKQGIGGSGLVHPAVVEVP